LGISEFSFEPAVARRLVAHLPSYSSFLSEPRAGTLGCTPACAFSPLRRASGSFLSWCGSFNESLECLGRRYPFRADPNRVELNARSVGSRNTLQDPPENGAEMASANVSHFVDSQEVRGSSDVDHEILRSANSAIHRLAP
jgi:hypothetical protein